MYYLYGVMLAGVFESLPDSTVSVVRIMKPDPLTRAGVELRELKQVVERRNHTETPAPLLMKRKNVVFTASLSCLHDGCLVIISVPGQRGSISLKLSQQNMRHRLVTDVARLPLLTTLRRQEVLLELADSAASKNLSEET